MTTTTTTASRERAHAIVDTLGALYPDAHCELDFGNALDLLVATILSAQSTDRRVNAVTPALFARYPDAAAYAAADRVELEELIRPTGFFHNKADALIRLGAALVADFDAHVPGTMDELTTLPSVGRKTANVVLNEVFGVPGLTTDTHVIRLAKRFGWTATDKPAQVENDVAALFEPAEYNLVNHRVIWHGRRRCHARKPACGACPLGAPATGSLGTSTSEPLCPSFGEGPTDPVAASALIREPRR